MADKRAQNAMNNMLGGLQNRQMSYTANRLASALQREPRQRPAAPRNVSQRPAPDMRMQPMRPNRPPPQMPLPPTSDLQLPPGAARPMPRPINQPGQNVPAAVLNGQIPDKMRQPIPRPIPSQMQDAYQQYRPQPIQQQPAFKPFPRPINFPGQPMRPMPQPDMFAGGTPNFDESQQQDMQQQLEDYRRTQLGNAQQQFPTYQPQPFNPYRKF